MLEAVWAKPEAAIAASNQAFMEAFAKGDAAGVAANYTVDAWAFPPGGPIVQGREAIQGMWQGVLDSGIGRIDLETLTVDVQGDVAIEVGQGVIRLANGEPADHVKYVVVWQRENGDWKLHRDIWNSLPPA